MRDTYKWIATHSASDTLWYYLIFQKKEKTSIWKTLSELLNGKWMMDIFNVFFFHNIIFVILVHIRNNWLEMNIFPLGGRKKWDRFIYYKFYTLLFNFACLYFVISSDIKTYLLLYRTLKSNITLFFLKFLELKFTVRI